MGLSEGKGGKRLADSGWDGGGRTELRAALRTEWSAEWMRWPMVGSGPRHDIAFQVAGGGPGWQVAGFEALKGEPETG